MTWAFSYWISSFFIFSIFFLLNNHCTILLFMFYYIYINSNLFFSVLLVLKAESCLSRLSTLTQCGWLFFDTFPMGSESWSCISWCSRAFLRGFWAPGGFPASGGWCEQPGLGRLSSFLPSVGVQDDPRCSLLIGFLRLLRVPPPRLWLS